MPREHPETIELSPPGDVEGGRSDLEDQGWGGVDGTSILDVNPYMRETEPRGTVAQPDWSHESVGGD